MSFHARASPASLAEERYRTGNHRNHRHSPLAFQPTATGTRVVTTESFAGKPVDDNVDLMQATLDTTLPAWLSALKAAAERRTS